MFSLDELVTIWIWVNDSSKFFMYETAPWTLLIIPWKILAVIPQRTVFPKVLAILDNVVFTFKAPLFIDKRAFDKFEIAIVPRVPICSQSLTIICKDVCSFCNDVFNLLRSIVPILGLNAAMIALCNWLTFWIDFSILASSKPNWLNPVLSNFNDCFSLVNSFCNLVIPDVSTLVTTLYSTTLLYFAID